MPFRDSGDQVGGAGEREGGREATDDRDDLSFQAELCQGFIDRSPLEGPSRDADVFPAGITGCSHFAAAQRMPHAHRPDEAVAKQRLCPQLRSSRSPDDSSLQINASLSQRGAIFVWLLQEAQPHPGSLRADARNECWPEVLHKALAGPQREGADQSDEVELLSRAENRFGLLHKLGNPFAKFDGPRCGDEAASGSDQERIAHGLTQTGQRAAHGGRAQSKPPGCLRDAAFRKEHIQGEEQVKIGSSHTMSAAYFGQMWRPTHEVSAHGASSACLGAIQAAHMKQIEGAVGTAETKSPVKWVLVSLSLSMLLPSLGTSIANVGLPTLAHTFDASFQEVQWVVLSYLLAITTLIVSVGRLGDMIGRRRLLLAGIGVFTMGSVLCGIAPTLGVLIAARAVQGLGAAIMMALSMAFIGETIPKARIGSAMGLLGTMSAIGTALGPSLGGVLIIGLSWRAIFLIKVPLGILAFLLAHRTLPADHNRREMARASFDPLGTLVLALTLAAYALAMTIGRGAFGPLNATLLLAAILGVGLFVLVEAKVASPLIRVAMFREPSLTAGFAMSALVATVLMATLVVGPFYLSRALGLDAALVGIVLTVGPLVAALTGVPAGRFVDQFGATRVTALGLIGIAIGCAMLSLMPTTLGIPDYIASIVVITAGYALFQTANNTSVMADIPPDQRGVISGVLNLSRNLGLITGASVMGAVFTLASASNEITTASPEAIAAGMRITFAAAVLLIMVALIIAVGSRVLARRRRLIRLSQARHREAQSSVALPR